MRALTKAQRDVAAIVIPPMAGTGLRHVVVPADPDATVTRPEDAALCGVVVDGWYMEHKDFDAKTIGCKNCLKRWNQDMKKTTHVQVLRDGAPAWITLEAFAKLFTWGQDITAGRGEEAPRNVLCPVAEQEELEKEG